MGRIMDAIRRLESGEFRADKDNILGVALDSLLYIEVVVKYFMRIKHADSILREVAKIRGEHYWI